MLLGAGVKVIDEEGVNDPTGVMYDLKAALSVEEFSLIGPVRPSARSEDFERAGTRGEGDRRTDTRSCRSTAATEDRASRWRRTRRKGPGSAGDRLVPEGRVHVRSP